MAFVVLLVGSATLFLHFAAYAFDGRLQKGERRNYAALAWFAQGWMTVALFALFVPRPMPLLATSVAAAGGIVTCLYGSVVAARIRLGSLRRRQRR